MNPEYIEIEWPNGKTSEVIPGKGWLEEAQKACIDIPTGCLTGSCGACEIEVNGKVLRACISTVPKAQKLKVDFATDPYW